MAIDEFSFLMVKPHAIDYAPEIFATLNKKARQTAGKYIDAVPSEVIRAHYTPHQDKPFFGPMIQEFVNLPVAIAVYEPFNEGRGVIKELRTILGKTDPRKASQKSLRGRMFRERKGGPIENTLYKHCGFKIIRNFVHASDSPEEARRELLAWRQYFSDKFIEDLLG